LRPDCRSIAFSDPHVYLELLEPPDGGRHPSYGRFRAAVLLARYFAFVAFVYGTLVHQRPDFHGDVVSHRRLAYGQGWAAASRHRGHSGSGNVSVARRVFANRLALEVGGGCSRVV